MWTRFRRTSGIRPSSGKPPRGVPVRRPIVPGARAALSTGRGFAALAVLSFGGCNYSFTAGAGLPSHIRTVAIVPFENETTRFDLTQELHEALLRELPRALGLTLAGEENADAIVSGTIQGYDVQAPNYRRGQQSETVQVLQRQVTLRVQAQILDRENYTILWEQQLRGSGQYLEASETEEVGRAEAIELCVQEIVDGAQSNW